MELLQNTKNFHPIKKAKLIILNSFKNILSTQNESNFISNETYSSEHKLNFAQDNFPVENPLLIENMKSDFIQKVEEIFEIKKISTVVEIEGNCGFSKVRKSEELTNFSLLKCKLDEHMLWPYVFSIQSKTVFYGNKSASHKIEFELKTNGLKWALLFSKHVLKDFNLHLSLAGGEVVGEYVCNVSTKRDKYILNVKSNFDEALFEEFNDSNYRLEI